MDDDELPYKVKIRKKMGLLSSFLENTDQQRKTKKVQAQESCPEKDYIHCPTAASSYLGLIPREFARVFGDYKQSQPYMPHLGPSLSLHHSEPERRDTLNLSLRSKCVM